MATWRELIKVEMKRNKDTWTKLVHVTDSDLDREFYDGYGAVDGEPFTLWTEKYVYFPVCYDGAEWVGSVRRDPCAKRTAHVGC